MARKMGGKALTHEEHALLIGRDGKEIMQLLCQMRGLIGNVDQLNNLRREHYNRLRLAGIPVIRENVELVREFANLSIGLRFSAVSSAPRTDIDENLVAAGLTDFFEHAVSAKEAQLKRKPAPDLWLWTMRQMGLAADECLAFEDSPTGVASAKSAGLIVIALPSPSTATLEFPTAELVIRPGEKKSATEIIKRFAQGR